ncbi:hypothetical protein B0J11DRAFT_81009 [Dendryphion nanum]|uniref:Transmembrane protein n=1 Tax=Dendryphion nanum TaxID=256645 RepID=A0A9P9IFM6_9PLEO|nr:hypothetical protein B0J11DRAFT_81009 [Dendryphion nanum]
MISFVLLVLDHLPRRFAYGTVYEFPGDPSPKLFPGCWPSWTGGTWYATRTMTSNSTSTSRPLDPDNGSQPWKIVVFVFVAIIGLGICYFGIKRGCAIARKRFNDAIEARVVQSRTADEEAIRSVRASRAPEHYVLSVNNSHEPPKTVQLADSSLAEREPVEAGNVSLKKGRKDSVQEIRSVTAGAHGRRLSEMEAMSRRSESPGRKNNAKRDSGQSSNDPIDVIGNGDSGEVMIATSEGYVDVVSGVHGISTASDDARSSDNTEPLQELEDNAQKRRSE